ncbi:5'-3' exonuclease [bacterium]|nr:5'-3' exonuclease [bacterium]
MKKALLIDANSLIYRLYFATEAIKNKNPKIDIKRQTVKLLYSICFSLVFNEEYDFKIAAFDSKEKLIRKQAFENYKANRKPMPDDLVFILPELRHVFELFGFVLLAKPGYEADDLIGSFSNEASKLDIYSTIYTSDKDLLQLINNKTSVDLFKKGISDVMKYDEANFIKDYGFNPNLIPDYKALAGDNSDNYHGVDGIGPKTAKELLQTYKNGIDEIYKHLDDIKESIRLKLIEGKDACYLCKEIAVINSNLFNDKNLDAFKALPIMYENLESTITALGFSSFYKYFDNKK